MVQVSLTVCYLALQLESKAGYGGPRLHLIQQTLPSLQVMVSKLTSPVRDFVLYFISRF